ncbi:flavin-containing monooxygenase [Nocardia heshunensis]
MARAHFEVAIIGAGPGGITAAHYLQRAGITDFVILERADDFGGSWRDNFYPGLAVDVPTLFYQFPFARKPDWSRLFPDGPEIQRYNRDVAQQLGLYAHFRGGSEVQREVWDEADQVWVLDIAGRESVTARFVINAVGGYINPKPTKIPGTAEFTGTILRPNAWDPEYRCAGKRVALIGTGSSSVQILSAIADEAASVDVYQRTPAWILPKPDAALSPRVHRVLALPGVVAALNGTVLALMELPLQLICTVLPRLPRSVLAAILPQYDKIWRALYRLLLRRQVSNPADRAALVPGYGILAKRPILSSGFFPALESPTVSLITDPIQQVTADGIRTEDGVERPYDLIVMATGYELFTDPETYRLGRIVGESGQDLAADYHRNGLRSYGGSAHPGFPNRWSLVGPQGYVGVAWHTFIDLTARHAVRLIAETTRRNATVAQVRPAAFDRWVSRMRRNEKLIRTYTVDCNPGLRTYFVNSQGDALYYRPQTISGAWWFSRYSPLGDYEFARDSRKPSPTTQTDRHENEASA